MDKLDKIHNRQLARLLAHLQSRGMLTHELETTLKRSFRFAFDDIKGVTDKEADKCTEATSKSSAN